MKDHDPDRRERGGPARWCRMLDDFLFLDVFIGRFCSSWSLLRLGGHWTLSGGDMCAVCWWGCWRRSVYGAVACFRRRRLEMRRRFPSLTVRRGGSVVTSYVAVDSEQTIGLNQKERRCDWLHFSLNGYCCFFYLILNVQDVHLYIYEYICIFMV